jgi:glyoxylase-like metal-dependent hydrolase (beta-lactamase superfamily II)
MEAWLLAQGAPPQSLALVVNSHYHGDHAGGNHELQARYGLRVAAHSHEGRLVNRRDPNACTGDWLGFPCQSYRVDRLLGEGEVLSAGGGEWLVLHTPGHTLGHISLWQAEARLLLAGDACHADDVPWINVYREGAAALDMAIASIERLIGLGPRWMLSGHGAPTADPLPALESARARLERWREDPSRPAWHAMKRIFTSALMVNNGLTRAELEALAPTWGWLRDYTHYGLGLDLEQGLRLLLEESLRVGAVRWEGGRLLPNVPYTPVKADWASSPTRVREWEA